MPNQEILIHLLLGHSDQVNAILFFLTDTILISSSEDYTLRAWDLKTFKCVRTLENVPGSLDILLAQNFVIAGNVEGELRFFRVSF